MNIIIFGLLSIIGLPALINGTGPANNAETTIKQCLGGGSNIIDSNLGELVFSNENRLGATDISLVKEGTYNGIKVAIKITWDRNYFDRELAAYEALNATGNEEIEMYGIPCIYYHGQIIGGYLAFAMTLFQENLANRYETQESPFSEFAVTLIMKQAVQTLAYLALKKVLHNDIKPDNIFLRDAEVFIADFGLATVNNGQIPGGGSPHYASASFYAKRDRYAVDDLESLVYSMWAVSGFEMGFFIGGLIYHAEGDVMYRAEQNNEVEERMRRQCHHFKEFEVEHAFVYICIQEILPKKRIPDYKTIIKLLTGTISEITKNSNKTTFEWLDKPPARRSFLFRGILAKLGKRKR